MANTTPAFTTNTFFGKGPPSGTWTNSRANPRLCVTKLTTPKSQPFCGRISKASGPCKSDERRRCRILRVTDKIARGSRDVAYGRVNHVPQVRHLHPRRTYCSRHRRRCPLTPHATAPQLPHLRRPTLPVRHPQLRRCHLQPCLCHLRRMGSVVPAATYASGVSDPLCRPS